MVKGVAPLAGPAALGDRVNMVWSGTAVTRGRGRAVVTATGMATEMGTVARLLGRTDEERTPLQREVDRIGRTLGLAVLVVAVVVVAAIQRMAGKRAIVKKLSSVETLGSASVVLGQDRDPDPRSTGGRDAITMQEVDTIGIAEVAASHTGGRSPSSLYRMTAKEGGRPGCKEDRERNVDTGLLVLRIVVGLLLVGQGNSEAVRLGA